MLNHFVACWTISDPLIFAIVDLVIGEMLLGTRYQCRVKWVVDLACAFHKQTHFIGTTYLQGQPRTSFSGNPYDVRRMQDGISRKSDYGNPISRRTIVPSRRTSDRMEGAPSAKRMRTEYSHSSQNRAIPNTAASSRGHRTSQRANKPQSRTSFPSNAEITIIVDDDEDMGVHITRVEGHESSPDPLRLAGNSTVFSPGSRPSRPVAHPFDVGDPMVSHAPYIEETNIIKELRQRNNHRKRKSEVTEVPDSESDGIEEFDDGPRADSSNRQNDNVRRKIKLYEEKEVQHLDLAAINKPRGRRPIAGSMKPRSSAPKQTGKSTLVKLNILIHDHDYCIYKIQNTGWSEIP